MKLKNRYFNLSSPFFETKKCEKLWLELLNYYTQSFRKYHNLNHLEEIFIYFDLYRNNINSLVELEFAIFYHDIIYNVFKNNNELKSAELVVKHFKTVNQIDTKLIYNNIMVTKTHEGNTNDEKLMIDFDLAILGQSYEVYQEYSKNIRDEYHLVPNFLYRKGRMKVLEHFLNKKTIYKTDIFQLKYEKQAQKNIQKELKYLKNGK